MRINKYTLLAIPIVLVAFIVKYDYVLIQKMNIEYLIDTGQSLRIFPHRVNSIGKLHDVWNDGIRSFEIDVLYGVGNTENFQVGHDVDAMSNASLEDVLMSVNSMELERIWLDLKNISPSNYKKVLLRLEYLERKFNIKEKVLLESGTSKPFFGVFSSQGWYVSFYLPTSKILEHLKNGETLELQKIASEVAVQSEYQMLSGVSFDKRLYPFTKKYLEPLIPENIEYHTWWGPSLKKYSFSSKLLKNEWFHDKRIKTILVKYKSQYHI